MSSHLDPDGPLARWLSDHQDLVTEAMERIVGSGSLPEGEVLAAVTHRNELPEDARKELVQLVHDQASAAGVKLNSVGDAESSLVWKLEALLPTGASLEDALRTLGRSVQSPLRVWLSDHADLVAQSRARIQERAALGERDQEADLLTALTHQEALPGPALEDLAEVLRTETQQVGLGTSSAHFTSGEGVPLLASRLGSGARLRDALIGCVYDGANSTSSRILAHDLSNEFWSMVSAILVRIAGARRSTGIDEIQSAIASVLGQEREVEFRTLGEFISYLSTRIHWKGRHRDRRMRPQQPLDQKQAEQMPESGPGPATQASQESEAERLQDTIGRLSKRDQLLVQARLNGTSHEDLSDQLGLGYEATRKASLRAWKRLLDLVRPSTPTSSENGDRGPEAAEPDEGSAATPLEQVRDEDARRILDETSPVLRLDPQTQLEQVRDEAARIIGLEREAPEPEDDERGAAQ